MQLLIISLLFVLTSCQSPSPNENEDFYNEFFNKTLPATTAPPIFEEITRNPLAPDIFTDKNGQSCRCVPYYLCKPDGDGVSSEEVRCFSGYNLLDPRFENSCQDSVEICCKNLKLPDGIKPKPDPSKVKRCGYRNPDGIGAKFNDDRYSKFGEFPWVVAVQDTNDTYLGVGALIHPEVVVTGAYIIRNYVNTANRLKIRAGEWDTQTIKEMYDHEDRSVREVYSHHAFSRNTFHNNVALLRLDRPLELAEHINVICLPEQDEVFDSHKNCVANGWGGDLYGLRDRYAVILKKLELDMVSHIRCNILLKRTTLGPYYRLPHTLVCAGGEEGKDTCKGDGGAPLACPLGNNRYKLTGLVAGGVGCGQKDVPGVYTKVSTFRRWIENKMAAWGLEVPTMIPILRRTLPLT